MAMPNDKLVVVDWIDSISNSKWIPKEDENEEPCRIRSVGYLHKETAKKVIIYASKNDFGGISDRSCIPRGCIKKIRRIKEPK